MHWPDEPGWLRDLTPADHELARTGLSFTDAICSTCMCSPSRATLFTGLYPTEHGVTLTHTEEGARPDPRHLPAVLSTLGTTLRTGEAPRGQVSRAFVRGLMRRGAGQGEEEPELDSETPNLARMLAEAGYTVGFKGKWHLTKPLGGEWNAADAERLARDYGFAGWEPPDAGENVEPSHFGGGNAGRSGQGWDEDFTRQAEGFLRDAPEPFALILSLVNPHDVLGYPASYEEGGYREEELRSFHVPLPATLEEDLSAKPTAHALMKLGQASYLGPLAGARAQLDYVAFYAYLHKLVDEKIGRIVSALGDPDDLRSLRSRTVVVRTADHGEMGLAHGGLRQKMFNAYEETLRVPLIISNPVLFPRAAETRAPAGLVDVMPTVASACSAGRGLELSGVDLAPVVAHHADPDAEALEGADVDLSALSRHPSARPTAQDASLFVYEDHKAGTAFENVVPQPNRLRCVRERDWKYAVYLDPEGGAEAQYELYDLSRDPLEADNLVDHRTGAARSPEHDEERRRLHETLAEATGRVGAALPAADSLPPQ